MAFRNQLALRDVLPEGRTVSIAFRLNGFSEPDCGLMLTLATVEQSQLPFGRMAFRNRRGARVLGRLALRDVVSIAFRLNGFSEQESRLAAATLLVHTSQLPFG